MTAASSAITAILAANRWFTELPEGAGERMVALSQRREYADGQLIHAKGDWPEGLMGVVSGRVRISSVHADGHEAILTYLEPGHWFGEIAMFDGRARTHDAWAEEKCTLLLLPRAEFNRLLDDRRELYPHFLRLMCQRLRLAFDVIEDTALLPFPARLARRLLQLAEAHGAARRGDRLIDLHLGQEQLAMMLGASRQTVNKCLKEWEGLGWIRIDYGRLALDTGALTGLVHDFEASD